MKKLILLLILSFSFSFLDLIGLGDIQLLKEDGLKILGGAGPPYGFGGINICYTLDKQVELSFGYGFSGAGLPDQNGAPLQMMVFGAKLFSSGAFWDPNFTPYVSFFHGAVGILQYTGTTTYFDTLQGATLGYGAYWKPQIEYIKFIFDLLPGLMLDLGVDYMILLDKVPDELRSSFGLFNFHIGAGISI